MLNHITIQGRFTRDPELRRTASGTAVTSFTIACDRDFSTEGKRETDFIDCVTWGKTAEFVASYFVKGAPAVASGRLQLRKYKDKQGNDRTAAEVVCENVYFAGPKVSEPKPTAETTEDDYEVITTADDSLPF